MERVALGFTPTHHTLARQGSLGLGDDGVLRFPVGVVVGIDDNPVLGSAQLVGARGEAWAPERGISA